MIDRTRYTGKIEPFVGKNLIKVLTGQRRVGKSAILQLVAEMIKDEQPDAHVMYIDKEDYTFEFLKTHSDLFNYIEEHKVNANNF
jgi:uncharacterized protein